VGGEAGALAVLEILREEIELAMALMGAPRPDLITAEHVRARPRLAP
jgi:isopentenyl diphosphate isomerase/L-lactate dehydrogenase-like FMN-dependent dehydrogenase